MRTRRKEDDDEVDYDDVSHDHDDGDDRIKFSLPIMTKLKYYKTVATINADFALHLMKEWTFIS